jgi:hypothetical protein
MSIRRTLIAVGVAAASLGVVAAPAGAGNKGTIKIHETGTTPEFVNNDPKVCTFDVEGFFFDEGQEGILTIAVQGGDAPTGVAPADQDYGPADEDGFMVSAEYNLEPGHYKATFTDEDGNKFKSKVFKVECGGGGPV